MIELTEQQAQALAAAGDKPPVVVDPNTNVPYVLIRKEVYERLTAEEYEEGPWSDEEMDQLAAEVDDMLDDDMAVEDDA